MSIQKRNLGGFNRIIFTSVISKYVLSCSSFLNKVKDKKEWILKTTYPLMAAMLDVASGRGSLLKMIIILIHNTSLCGGEYYERIRTNFIRTQALIFVKI